MAEGNNGYTQSQIAAMQRDAMRRVNEMQRISKEKLGSGAVAPNHAPPVPTSTVINEFSSEPSPVEQCETEVISDGFTGFLDKLNLDSEMILLVVMLLLLVNEGADIKLILALVYILL